MPAADAHAEELYDHATDVASTLSGHILSRDVPKFSGHTGASVVTGEQSALPDFVDTLITAMVEHTSRASLESSLEISQADSPTSPLPKQSGKHTPPYVEHIRPRPCLTATLRFSLVVVARVGESCAARVPRGVGTRICEA